MYSKFENLAKEKKQKIIRVCIGEFSQHGYQNASTNRIVKNAEISKGILFHYFGTKKSLYLYVLDYVLEFVTDKVYAKMVDLPADFFERVMETGIIKLRIAHEYSAEYKMILEAFTHPPAELEQEIQARYKKLYQENLPLLFKDLDTSKFREDIAEEKAVEIIMLTLEGISDKYINMFKQIPSQEVMSKLEQLTQDYQAYIDILKYGIYEKN